MDDVHHNHRSAKEAWNWLDDPSAYGLVSLVDLARPGNLEPNTRCMWYAPCPLPTSVISWNRRNPVSYPRHSSLAAVSILRKKILEMWTTGVPEQFVMSQIVIHYDSRQ